MSNGKIFYIFMAYMTLELSKCEYIFVTVAKI
jgi:hypothetical protein